MSEIGTENININNYTTARGRQIYAPISPNQPIYSPGNVFKTVLCQVCRSIIKIGGQQNLIAIQCSNCHEATPIKNPPAGKYYYRCTCDCLLLTRITSTQVSCPRRRCGRVLHLKSGFIESVFTKKNGTDDSENSDKIVSKTDKAPNQPLRDSFDGKEVHSYDSEVRLLNSLNEPDGDRELERRISSIGGKNLISKSIVIRCGRCSLRFYIDQLAYDTAVRCPHCGTDTSVGSVYARRKWILLIVFALVIFLLLCVPSVSPYELNLYLCLSRIFAWYPYNKYWSAMYRFIIVVQGSLLLSYANQQSSF